MGRKNKAARMDDASATRDDRIVRTPRDIDVLAERGSASKIHPGNARYWKIIIETRGEYLALGKEGNESEKKEIAEAVADQVHRYGGYFLRRDKKVGPHWYEVDSKVRIEKIQNALREIKNIPEPVRDYAKEQHPAIYDLFLQASKRKAEMIDLRSKKEATAGNLMNVAKKRRRSDSFDGDPVGSRALEPLIPEPVRDYAEPHHPQTYEIDLDAYRKEAKRKPTERKKLPEDHEKDDGKKPTSVHQEKDETPRAEAPQGELTVISPTGTEARPSETTCETADESTSASRHHEAAQVSRAFASL